MLSTTRNRYVICHNSTELQYPWEDTMSICRFMRVQGILLALTGRNTERLHSVAKECEKHGARVMSKVVDVTDAEGMESFINEVDEKLPIDLVIANAGITETTAKTKTIEESTRKLFNVNVQGVFNTVLPVIPLMKRRSGQMGRQQHICIVSSIASFMSPLGNSSVYSTTKVAVRQDAEGLRAELARDGIGVSAVCPGYVDSRMTAQNKFHMPLKVGPEVASKKIREGISYNVPYICFPAVLSGLGEAVQSIPAMIRHWMTQIGLLRALSLVYKSRKSGSKKE